MSLDEWSDECPWIGQYILDERGEPVPAPGLIPWGMWLQTAERRVAVTQFAWGCVSTCFLGLDHCFMPEADRDPLTYRPTLWETMVFGGRLDLSGQRYRSREEALEGHRAMVEKCLAAAKDPADKITIEANI